MRLSGFAVAGLMMSLRPSLLLRPVAIRLRNFAFRSVSLFLLGRRVWCSWPGAAAGAPRPRREGDLSHATYHARPRRSVHRRISLNEPCSAWPPRSGGGARLPPSGGPYGLRVPDAGGGGGACVVAEVAGLAAERSLYAVGEVGVATVEDLGEQVGE
jgi:hypothetical protein